MSCNSLGLFSLGSLVKVKCGKYAGSFCAVLGTDEKNGRILIADGRNISVKKMKQKNIRHVQETGQVIPEIAERAARGKVLDDGWLQGILKRQENNNFTACLEEVG